MLGAGIPVNAAHLSGAYGLPGVEGTMLRGVIRAGWYAGAVASCVGIIAVGASLWLHAMRGPSFEVRSLHGIEARTGIRFPERSRLVAARASDCGLSADLLAVVAVPADAIASGYLVPYGFIPEEFSIDENLLLAGKGARVPTDFAQWHPAADVVWFTARGEAWGGAGSGAIRNSAALQVCNPVDGWATVYVQWGVL